MDETGKDRFAARLAWSLFGLSIALCLVGVALFIPTRDVPVTEYYGWRGATGIVTIPFATMGALLAARRRQNPIGWLFLAGGVATGFGVFAEEYATYSFDRHDSGLPLTDFVAWAQNWMWILLVAVGLVYPFLLFPEGHLPSRRWRWLAWLAAPVMVVFAVSIAFEPVQLQSLADGFINPYAWSKTTTDTLVSIVGAPFMAVAVLSIYAMARRFRRSTGDEHEQMKWLLFAGSLTTLMLLANLVAEVSGLEPSSAAYKAVAIATQASIGGIAVAAGIAVLKYRLYDIDVVVSKAVLYGALALGIGAVYVGVVVGIGAAVGTLGEANVPLSVAGTALVAVAFQPLRSWASRFANRFVYGKRATPHEVLSVLGERIADAYSLEEILPRLARLVTEGTAASSAEIWVRVGGELRPSGAWPHDIIDRRSIALRDAEVPFIAGAEHVFPVRHQGELLGVLAASAPANEPLTSADAKLLTDLASQAGLLLRNVRLIEELRASRQRLVTAQDAERRRIERNLHDGAQQHLVALSVNLRLARTLLDSDEASARGILEQLQSEASDALENLRDLARGIYPPLLADKGLPEAVTAQAHKAPVPVTVDAVGIGRYPMEVESAIYFCVLEALQNVAKYAGASAVRVRIATDNGRLTFAVTDDGVGFDAATVARGAGLTNMTDRLEALGGRVEIESRPGAGTSVRGWVAATSSS